MTKDMQLILDEMRSGFTQVNERLDRIETRLNGVETRLNGVEGRLDSLEDKVEANTQEIIRINLNIEHNLEQRIAVLFDGYKQNSDKIDRLQSQYEADYKRLECQIAAL